MGNLRLLALLTAAVLTSSVGLASGQVLELGFDGAEDGLPDGWRHVALPSVERSTRYQVATVESRTVLRALSDRSASFLIRPVPRPSADFILTWRWRVSRSSSRGGGRSKETDDFPARVWVGFETDWSRAGWLERRRAAEARERFGVEPPGTWIHYVWAVRGRTRGEGFDEPYAEERVKCVALRCGGPSGWATERVDPAADWSRLFGGPAPRVAAVAVMVDMDDTAGAAEAWFADMRLEPRSVGPPPRPALESPFAGPPSVSEPR